MRLFVAVWPPPHVVDVLSSLPLDGDGDEGIRWTRPESWHVTLRFLGSVDDELVDDAVAALRAGLVDGPGPVEARLGDATACFGRSILVVPVDGLDALAAAAVAATAAFGEPPDHGDHGDHGDDRPFRGHLTLARSGGRGRRRRGPDLRRYAGIPVPSVEAVAWTATELTLVRSAGGRYEVLATVPAGPAAPAGPARPA